MARFLSSYAGLTLVMKPSRRVITDGVPVFTPGVKARFRDGRFVTNDPNMIAWLRKHPGNFANGGNKFVEEGLGTNPKPVRQEMRRGVVNAEMLERGRALVEQNKAETKTETETETSDENDEEAEDDVVWEKYYTETEDGKFQCKLCPEREPSSAKVGIIAHLKSHQAKGELS